MEIMQSESVVLEPLQSSVLGKPLLRVVRMMQGDHPSLPSVSVYFQGCDAYQSVLDVTIQRRGTLMKICC